MQIKSLFDYTKLPGKKIRYSLLFFCLCKFVDSPAFSLHPDKKDDEEQKKKDRVKKKGKEG